MKIRQRLAAAAAGALCVLLAGCWGSDDDNAATPVSPQTYAAGPGGVPLPAAPVSTPI